MIATFGEIMLRLAPTGYLRFAQTSELQMTFGGGEANVAVSLAYLGMDAKFVSGLPDNPIGERCIGELRRWGVCTKDIIVRPGRMGIYYCEKGASQRASQVTYDRANSVVSLLGPKDFDWDKIFEGVTWFHFTGITPALSDSMAEATLEAVKKAKAKGITISCDLNYRKKLWTREKAGKVMAELVPYVDVLIANEADANDVFGIKAGESDVTKGVINTDGYIDVAKQLVSRFGVKKVAITLRESISASENNWAAMLYDAKTDKAELSKKYKITIIDRVGGGDSFGAGLIYGFSNGMNDKDTLEFAVASSCLKHSIEGDFNCVSVKEVLALAGGDGSGRVQR